MDREESDFKKTGKIKFKQTGTDKYQRDIKPNERDTNLNTQNDERLQSILSKLIPDLTEEERLALYKGYVNPFSKIAPFSLINDFRKKALKKLCEGVQKHMTSPSIVDQTKISPEKYSTDEPKKHSEFKKLIDAYLLDELTENVKTVFEEHMLDCDSCGDLLLLSREIVNILINDGKILFADIFSEENNTEPPIDQPTPKPILPKDKDDLATQNSSDCLSAENEDTKIEFCPDDDSNCRLKGKSLTSEIALGLFFALPLAKRGLPVTQRLLSFLRLYRILPCSFEFSNIIEAILLRFL
ncbi:zf-HC2 domain-containing protein [bacterium]|nr:zf-HC2 domain-containing protein [bacterium]